MNAVAMLRLLARRTRIRKTRTPILAARCLSFLCGCFFAAASVTADEHARETPRRAVLHLTNGGYLTGTFRPSDDPQQWQWQADHFRQPFRILQKNIRTVHFAQDAKIEKKAPGDYGVELPHGDIVHGKLVDLSQGRLALDTTKFGLLHIDQARIRRFYLLDGQELIYRGPVGLERWMPIGPVDAWRDDAGHPLTDRPEASMYGDFRLPAQAEVEFELSWSTKPDFILALGVDQTDSSVQKAFCFEVWFKDVIVQREAEREADLAALQDVAPGPGRLHVIAFLDQVRGRMLVYSPAGFQLADLTVAPTNAKVLPGIRLTNKAGDIRLERLRISAWNGVAPLKADNNKPRIHRTDGSILYAERVQFHPQSRKFTVVDDKQAELTIAEREVNYIYLSPPTAETAPPVRAVMVNGTQLTGEVTTTTEDHVSLRIHGIQKTIRFPTADLHWLLVSINQNASEQPLPNIPGLGTLTLPGARLHGQLDDGKEQPESSCLVWKPTGIESSSALLPTASGQIVYRDPPPARTRSEPVEARRPPVIRLEGQVIVDGQRLRESTGNIHVWTVHRSRSLHLRSGDNIPCEIQSIDERGVTFSSPSTNASFISHEEIKAVELVPVSSPPQLPKSKRDRLLTLPRSQKNSPPTHLVFSNSGDVLRGRVLGLNDKELQMEVQLETQRIPRERIARIIWLHADELDGAATSNEKQPPAKSPPRTRVQIVRSDGNRLTFYANKVEGNVIFGQSDILGPCHSEIATIDKLLIGRAIEENTAALTYHTWKLQHAQEPLFMQADASQSSGSSLPGANSELVGKPAPEFQLDLLEGGVFRLSGARPRVVVLDFWATWCGPCLKSLPELERVVQEFNDHNVQLVGVNLEEQPAQIKATLERHKLSLPVALDRDGMVAAKYQASAIPQTVVIDREGKVVRVFVGYNPKLADELRELLATIFRESPAAASPAGAAPAENANRPGS